MGATVKSNKLKILLTNYLRKKIQHSLTPSTLQPTRAKLVISLSKRLTLFLVVHFQRGKAEVPQHQLKREQRNYIKVFHPYKDSQSLTTFVNLLNSNRDSLEQQQAYS